MADISQVENVLTALIAQAIYPDGTGNPSITGQVTNIYRGWPIARNLDQDLANNQVNISVVPWGNARDVTRFWREWQPVAQPTNSLTATVSGQSVALGGTSSSPLNVAITATNRTYVYAVQPADTLTSIATAMAALVNADQSATSSGAVITIPAASGLNATVGGTGAMIRELRRQKQNFMVTFWCPDPDTRDAIVPAVDLALTEPAYITLPDGSAGRIIYAGTTPSDRGENENLYRRDLIFSVEYATTQTQAAYQIVSARVDLIDFVGNPLPAYGASLALEQGGYMLMENGDRLYLEYLPPHADSLLLESGGFLVGENSSRFLLDEPGFIQLEDGAYLLTQTGDRFILDPVFHGDSLKTEDGAYILQESGYSLLLNKFDGLLLENGSYLLQESGSELLMDAPDSLLMESGDYLTQESGGRLAIDTVTANSLLLENGGYMVQESGGKLFIDNNALLIEAGGYVLLEAGGHLLM